MADNADQILSILVKTAAELGGADAVQKALDNIKASTTDVKSATNTLAEATSNLGSAQQETAGHADKLHISHSQLHKLMHLIGSGTAPELGKSLASAFSGPIGIVLALGFAVEGVLGAFREYSKELDAQGAESAKPAFDAVKLIETEWDSAKQKMGEYMAAVADAGKDKDSIDEQIKNEKDLTNAKLDGIKKVVEELGKEEIARLRAAGADESAINMAEERTRKASASIDDRKKAGDVDALKKEFEERTTPGRQKELEEQAREATEKERTATEKLKSIQAELAELRGGDSKDSPAKKRMDDLLKLEEAMDRVKELKFYPSDILAVDAFQAMGTNAGRKGTARDMLNEDLAAARAQEEREKRRIGQLEDQLEPATTAATLASNAANRARTEGKRNAERVAALPDLIGFGAAGAALSSADSIITAGVTAENDVQRTGKATKQQEEAITRLREFAIASGTNMESILNILAINHKVASNNQQDIDTIKQQFIQLSQRVDRVGH